jgi:RNA polymerase sigma-70 factor (ECF subfamily)
VRAFENADIDALMRLLRDEVRLEMPPERTWFTGRETVGHFIAERIFSVPGSLRLLPITANGGQPAMATYWRRDEGQVFRAHALQVLTVRQHRIAGITLFRDTSLFRTFGLSQELRTPTASASSWSA